MGKKMKQKWLALVLMSTMLVSGLAGCGEKDVAGSSDTGTKQTVEENEKETPSKKDEEKVEKEEKKETAEEDELIVIRYGSHAAAEEDPNYKDPITGEYLMDEETRQIKLQALEAVREELGVDLQFVQYPGDVTEVLLKSVLAGDPIAEIVRIYQGAQGTILGQNILQPVDDYVHLLPHEPMDVYGKKYFISIGGGKWMTPNPLFYNINYIEAVPGLKEDGKTVYPTDLYLSGDWTWSVFKDYLQTIDTYYANSQAPDRPEERIEAYQTSYRDAAFLAIHTNGGSIYGAEGLAVDSPETIEAVAYIQELIDSDLLKSDLVEGTSTPVGNQGPNAMKGGETVFTNIADWLSYSVVGGVTERGESMGYVPFPRPDDMAFDDPNYRHGRNGGESYALLKGIEEEHIPLAIESYYLYHDTINELNEEIYGEPDPTILKSPHLAIDIFHPEIGVEMHQMFWDVVDTIEVTELSDIVGINGEFYGILGDSLYGLNGAAAYDIAIESDKAIITDKISKTEQILDTDTAKDNIRPKIAQATQKFYAFPLGTDLATVDFTSDFEANDNVDGVLDIGQLKVDYSSIDTNAVGKYGDSLVVTIVDSAGNEGKSSYPVVIYDPENKEAPTVTIKEEYRTLAVDTEVATINWKNDFIAEMVDADGIPLETLVVDLSELDATTAGTYAVGIEVEDFAGNVTTVSIDVTVE